MNQVKYEIIPLTEENINLLEHLRYNAYNINKNDFPPENTLYTRELKQGKYLVFGCYLNNQLIGACYTTNTHNTLHIAQLFIAKKHQKSNLHLGTKLLQFTLHNKNIAEQYFKTKFFYSTLDAYKNTSDIYKNIGYEEKELYFRKRL